MSVLTADNASRSLFECVRLALALGVLVAVLVPSADAAFPGRNGRVAFDNVAMLSVGPGGSGLDILGSGYHPKYSPSGRMVAYGCGTDVQDNCRRQVGIRIRRADGRGRPRPITRNHWDDHPDWSPGGHRIVFTRYPDGRLTDPELWIYHRGHTRRLTEGEEPAWSIKGEIAFTRVGSVAGEPWDVYVIRPDGSHLRRIGAGFDPEWSPRGGRLIHASNSGVYTVRRDGRHRRRLTSDGAAPDFSPDGRKVVFSPSSEDQIVVMRSNGTRPQVLFQAASDVVATDPDWQSLPRRKRRRRGPCGANARIAC